MKGIIRKYYANTEKEDLRDSADKYGCTELISDPDFWSNHFPIWSICGPYVRATLEVEDIIFFLPNKKSLEKLGLNEYICAGVLYVSEVINDSKQFQRTNGISKDYYKRYQIDLYKHQQKDKPRTRKIRDKNIIIGDPKKIKMARA